VSISERGKNLRKVRVARHYRLVVEAEVKESCTALCSMPYSSEERTIATETIPTSNNSIVESEKKRMGQS
jgi:hypothetical protein